MTPDIVCGTSVGAINGAKIAEGAGATKELQAIWLSLQTNRDMFLDEPWLASLSDDRVIAFFGAMASDIGGTVAGSSARSHECRHCCVDTLDHRRSPRGPAA